MSQTPERELLLERIQQSRSPLRKGMDFTSLNDEELAQADAALTLFEPQHKMLKKLVTQLFMLAGLLWIPLFFPSIAALAPDVYAAFKSNQGRLYLILLSLWGYVKHRRMRQMVTLLQLSTRLNKPWFALTREDLISGEALSTCEGLIKLPGSDKSYFHIVFVWIFALLGVGQIVRQCVLLFG